MPSLAEQIAMASTTVAPPELRQRMQETNSGMPFWGVPSSLPPPRFTGEALNKLGYTITKGPMAGQVVVTPPGLVEGDALPRENILGHEAFHAKVVANGGNLAPARMGGTSGTYRLSGRSFQPNDDVDYNNPSRDAIDFRMSEVQNPKEKMLRHWGARPNSGAEEQMANLFGYEASLPRGTSIMDTPIGQQVLPTQRDRDYYFTQTSIPHGGVWEGQSDPSLAQQFQQAVRRYLTRSGFNMAR